MLSQAGRGGNNCKWEWREARQSKDRRQTTCRKLEVEVTPPLEINLSGGGGGKGVACEAVPSEATQSVHHSTNCMYTHRYMYMYLIADKKNRDNIPYMHNNIILPIIFKIVNYGIIFPHQRNQAGRDYTENIRSLYMYLWSLYTKYLASNALVSNPEPHHLKKDRNSLHCEPRNTYMYTVVKYLSTEKKRRTGTYRHKLQALSQSQHHT